MSTGQMLAYELALADIGLAEIPGAEHNPKIVEMFLASGHGWVHDDETPWCAASMNKWLSAAGLVGTGKLNAKSFLTWGQAVKIENARRGDVVVLWRKSPDGPYGHVAFFVRWLPETGEVELLGGNQGDRVCKAAYDDAKVLAVRRAKAPRKAAVQTKTVQASAINIASGAGTAASAVAMLDGTAQYIVLGGAVVCILAGMWIFRERLLAWSRGWK